VETLPPAELDSVKKQKQKKVIESDRTLTSRAPARLVSSGRGAREGAERADAGRGTPVPLVHFCVAADAANDVIAWQGRVITGRWSASDRPPADAFGARFPSLVPYWSRPDTGPVESDAFRRHVQCDRECEQCYENNC
jgi:hypothetical protein